MRCVLPSRTRFGPFARKPGGKRQAGAGRSRAARRPGCSTGWARRRADRRAADPCQLPKACKNAVELDGTRAAHRRDGAALTRFLAWLARSRPKAALREIDGRRQARSLPPRRRQFPRSQLSDHLRAPGPNGAIVHYRATPGDRADARAGQLYLVDSGGQYLDGTTDVTRTVAVGTPTAEMKDRFTRVLKGHIALATCALPGRHQRARSSTRWRGTRCGRRGSITIMAPAMASAAISRA